MPTGTRGPAPKRSANAGRTGRPVAVIVRWTAWAAALATASGSASTLSCSPRTARRPAAGQWSKPSPLGITTRSGDRPFDASL